jgi:glutamine amidotransferase
MIAIVDYDAGNLRSVQRALERQGHAAHITSSGRDLLAADGVILPGVGAAGAAMRTLRERDLIGPLREVVAAGTPFLGVCLGLQVSMGWSEEDGGVECLGLLPGVVRLLPGGSGLKIPHMGWNDVVFQRPHLLLDGIASGSHFYFVHSYYVEPADPSAVVATTEHGLRFAAVAAKDNVFATQFHPEKSSVDGLRIYHNFARLCARAPAAGRPIVAAR